MHLLHGKKWAWVVATFALTVASSAAAQDAVFTVVTNDGSTYEGQLVENVVGQHVTIKLASGEIRTFQASDVRSAASSTTTTTTITTPTFPIANMVIPGITPGTPGGPPLTYAGSDAVSIHVEKDDASGGRLFVETASGWAPVCTMPCSTTVDPKVDYKLYNSDAFRFPRNRGPLDLVVDHSARRAFRTAGAIMSPVGGVGIVMGILFAANVFTNLGTPVTPAEQKAVASTQSSDAIVGGVMIGASIAMMITGFVFLGLNPAPSMTTRAGERIVKRDGIKLTPTGLVF